MKDDLEYMCASYLEDELRDIEMRDHEANEEATENKQLADLLEWKHDFTEFVEATVSDGCGVWVSLFGETDSAAGSQQRAARRDPREDATPCPRLLSETTLLHHVHPAQRRIQCDVRVHGARRREDGRCVRRNSTVSLRASPLSTVGFSDALIHVFDMTTPPSRSDAVRHKRRRFEESDACGAHSNGKLDLEMRSSEALDSDLDATSKAGPFPTVRFRGHTKSVTSVSWFEEDGIFLSGSIDGTIRLWSENLKTNICVFKYMPPFSIDGSQPWIQGTPLSSTGRGGMPRWLLLLERLHGSLRTPLVHRDHGAHSHLRRYAIAIRQTRQDGRLRADHAESVDIVRWHPGCSYFGAATADGQFRLWDVAAPKYVRLFKQSPSLTGTRAMSCFRFGPDGNSIVCGFDDGRMEIRDLRQSSEVMSTAEAHKGPIWSIDCSRGNGNLIATGSLSLRTTVRSERALSHQVEMMEV